MLQSPHICTFRTYAAVTDTRANHVAIPGLMLLLSCCAQPTCMAHLHGGGRQVPCTRCQAAVHHAHRVHDMSAHPVQIPAAHAAAPPEHRNATSSSRQQAGCACMHRTCHCGHVHGMSHSGNSCAQQHVSTMLQLLRQVEAPCCASCKLVDGTGGSPAVGWVGGGSMPAGRRGAGHSYSSSSTVMRCLLLKGALPPAGL